MDLDLPNQEFIIQMIEKSSWFVVQTGGKKENIKKKEKQLIDSLILNLTEITVV